MSTTFRETLADVKKYRELLEDQAREAVLEQVGDRIRLFIDARLNQTEDQLAEQQIGVTGPGGFPYQGEEVVADTSDLTGPEASTPPGVMQPVVATGDAVMGGTPAAGDDATVATVLDLDAVEAEAEVAASAPEVPFSEVPDTLPDTGPVGDAVLAQTEGEPSPEEIAADIGADELDVAATPEFDEDLVQIVEPETLVGAEEEEDEDVLTIDFDEEEDEDEDFITIDAAESTSPEARLARRLRRENSSAIGTEESGPDVYNQLSSVESLYAQLVESDDLVSQVKQLRMIQETLRENQTLRDAIKHDLAAGKVRVDEFRAIFNVSLSIEADLRKQLAIYESTRLDIVEDDAGSQVAAIVEIDDVIDHFGGGHVADKTVVRRNETTGPMTADEVVYETDLEVEDSATAELAESNNPQHKVLLEETNTMSDTRNEEYIEIDKNELREALKRLSRRRRLSEMEQPQAGDPGTPPEPLVNDGLGDSDACMDHVTDGDTLPDTAVTDDPTEVEAADYAKTSAGDKRPPAFEALERRVRKLERSLSEKNSALAEAKLANRKLMAAFKLTQKKGLTQEQKRSISKHLKNAKTVREVDLVFETIMEQIEASNKSAVNEAQTRAGASSRVATSSSPKKITEGKERRARTAAANPFARWQQLSGLDK